MAASVKSFVVCADARAQPGTQLHDLTGAGVDRLRLAALPDNKLRLWIYLQMTDDDPQGKGQFALRRADSWFVFPFPSMTVHHRGQPLLTTIVADLPCYFPAATVYLVEF